MEDGKLSGKTVYTNNFLKILHKNINKNIIIIPKKNIKKAVLRVRMRRKIKPILRESNKIGFFFVSLVKSFYDFKQIEIEKIQKKINQYVKQNIPKI